MFDVGDTVRYKPDYRIGEGIEYVVLARTGDDWYWLQQTGTNMAPKTIKGRFLQSTKRFEVGKVYSRDGVQLWEVEYVDSSGNAFARRLSILTPTAGYVRILYGVEAKDYEKHA